MEGATWLDRRLYPFGSHHLPLADGRLHYVDEGAGAPVVLVHGNPTWSFMFRHVIARLARSNRCVAPDHLGFGLSDRPSGGPLRPQQHAANFARLMDHLDLREITLVVHDWGGPIALAYALDNPARVRRIVVANSWIWPVDDWRLRGFSALLGNRPAKRLLAMRGALPARALSAAICGGAPPNVRRHYRGPLQRPEDRLGAALLPGCITSSRAWLGRLWRRRGRLRNKTALLAWGMRDPVFQAAALARWQGLFADAHTVRCRAAGHFVFETEGPVLAERIAQFVATGA